MGCCFSFLKILQPGHLASPGESRRVQASFTNGVPSPRRRILKDSVESVLLQLSQDPKKCPRIAGWFSLDPFRMKLNTSGSDTWSVHIWLVLTGTMEFWMTFHIRLLVNSSSQLTIPPSVFRVVGGSTTNQISIRKCGSTFQTCSSFPDRWGFPLMTRWFFWGSLVLLDTSISSPMLWISMDAMMISNIFQQIPQDVSFSNIKVVLWQVPHMGMQWTTVSYKMGRPVAVPNVL